MAKPSDFFIGIQDFFAILLPGAAATYLLSEEMAAREYHTTIEGEWQLVGAFAVSAYVLGHLIFLLGSFLDPAYDRWFRRRKTYGDDGVFRAANKLRASDPAALPGASFSTLKWCRAYISLRSASARSELDYYEATSKFFRSLVVLLTFVALGVLFSQIGKNTSQVVLPISRLALAALAAVLAGLCFLRFCDQRWKLTESAYAYAVLISTTKPPPVPADHVSSSGDSDE